MRQTDILVAVHRLEWSDRRSLWMDGTRPVLARSIAPLIAAGMVMRAGRGRLRLTPDGERAVAALAPLTMTVGAR